MSTQSPYRLAIVDLDDTLLGKDKKVSAANLHALDKLRAAGIEIVVASGRHHLSIASFEDITGCQGWIISAAGAMVKHALTGEVLHEFTVPVGLALEIYQRNRESGDSLIAYHRSGIYVEEMTELIRLDARRSMQLPQEGDLQALARDGLQKLMWSAPPERIEALFPSLEREYIGRLYVVHTEPEIIEFLSPEANKARGALVVADQLCISREEVVAFGDGNNDVPVLEWAGFSVAMDHGCEAARRAAKKVTPPGPHNEAFARAVELVLGS